MLSCSSSSSGRELDQNVNGHKTVQNRKNHTKFDNLNDDILYLILNQSGLDTQLSMAHVNSRSSNMAHFVVRRKYKNHSIDIAFDRDAEEILLENNNRITIYNLPFALNMFKNFGHYFRAIKIRDDSLELVDVTKIINQITKYCSKSVKRLELESKNHDLLDKFTETLEQVEELIIDDGVLNARQLSVEKPLNELFPNLRRLIIYSRCQRVNFINSELPHSLHFEIFIGYSIGPNTRIVENVKEFIQKNPTIRSLEIGFYHATMIHFISQHLPQLESLTLYNLGIESDELRMENVKEFRLTTDDICLSSYDKLSLPRLVSLDIRYTGDFRRWVPFLNKHPLVRHLHSSDIVIGPDHINELMANYTNLSDVTIDTCHNWELDTIVQFMENHQKLEKFQIRVSKAELFPELSQRRTDLLEQFGDEWIVEELEIENDKALSIVRKSSVCTMENLPFKQITRSNKN